MPPPTYPRETLVRVASEAAHMTDFLVRMGVQNTPRRRRTMRARLARLGIPTDHWERSPYKMYSDDALAAAVANAVSYAGALRILGVPNTGGQHAHLARRVRKAGIDTSHFLGQAHNRGKTFPRRPPEQVLVILPPGSGRPRTVALRRAMLAAGVAYRCKVCGSEPEWQGQPLPLVIDHVNGDWLDNRLENLRFLCPNCHAQTSTWCRKKPPRTA